MRRLATPTRLFVAGFLLLQLAWVLTVPPFRGMDEFDHVYRAASVADGDWVADKVPSDGRGLLVVVPRDIVEAAHAQCAALRYTGPDNCSPAGQAPGGRVLVASGAANYQPAFYVVVGLAGRPFNGTTSLYVMRVATALLSAVFLALAAWSATRTRGYWPVVGLAVALTPVLIYSTTVVAPNGVELTAAVALWCSLLRLRVELDPAVGRRLLAVAVVSAVAMCSLRFLGPVWVALIVAGVAAFDWDGVVRVARQHRRDVITGSVAVLASLVGFIAWISVVRSVSVPPDDIDVHEALSPLHLVLWMMQSIAAFPFRNQPGPAIIYAVCGSIAVTLFVAGVRLSNGARRRAVVASALGAVFIPMVATLLTYDGGEIIWQGRYGLPFGVGFVLLATAVVAEQSAPVVLPRVGVVLAALAYAVAVVWCLVKVRDAELLRDASVVGGAWHVPSLLLLGVLVLGAIAAWTAAGARQPVVEVAAFEAAGDRS